MGTTASSVAARCTAAIKILVISIGATQATLTLATSTVTTQIPVMDATAKQTSTMGSAAEPKNQPALVSVTPIHKKCTQKSSLVKDKEGKAGPSQKQEEEAEKDQEETTSPLSLSELWKMRKDFSHHPSEHITTWLLQCWDNGISSLKLEGKEAKQLGSLSTEASIDPSATGLLKAEEQQVLIATTTVHQKQYHTETL